jgi:hypothetical protein
MNDSPEYNFIVIYQIEDKNSSIVCIDEKNVEIKDYSPQKSSYV